MFWRSWGSIPVGDSDFFFLPLSFHVDKFTFQTFKVAVSSTLHILRIMIGKFVNLVMCDM